MFSRLYKALRRITLLCGILMLVMFTVGGVMAQEASWTVLVYIEGDNNLEGDALADIQEMEIAGSSDAVNIVVQIDRAEDYSAADGDWTEARRYLVQKNPNMTDVFQIIDEKFGDTDTATLGTKHLQSLGETNNGDPQTLIDFALWGVETYPAEKYALVLWNHGGTWIGGFGGDDSTDDHDNMNIPELDQALSVIVNQMGQKFEFIGFDTCLMGGYEIFSFLSNYANYGAASEELEPGFGWYYSPVVEALINNPSINGGAMAETIVTGYMSFYDDLFTDYAATSWYDLSGQPYGQTAVDFSKMGALNSAMSQFTSIAINNMDSELVSAIGDARNNVQMFMQVEPDEANYYGSTDLMHFMELLQRFSTNVDVNAAAQAVINAIDDLVILHQATAMPGARGVSIYFPANQRFYTEIGLDTRYAAEVPYMSEWTNFLEAFYGLAVSEAVDNESSIAISNVVKLEDTVNTLQPPTLIIDTVGTDIVSLSFSAILRLDNGTEYMIDSSSLSSSTITEDGEELTLIDDGESSTQYTWGVDMPVITDGENFVDTVLLETGDDETLVVTGDYTFSNGESVDAYIVFNIDTQQAGSVWGINQSESGGQPFEIPTRAGEVFVPSWRYFDEEGDVQLTPSGIELVFGNEPFRYDFFPAESGTYDLYVFMTDVAGNVFFDAVELLVDNTGVDTTYRGVADVNFGYNAIYPFDWYGATDIEDEDGNLRTIYADNDGLITVFFDFYEATALEDMDVHVEDYLDIYATETHNRAEIIVDGYDGYEIEYYTITDDGDELYGVVVYTVVPENELGYLIDYSITGEPTDGSYDYYGYLINTITFFEPLFDAMPDGETGNSIADLLTQYGYTVEEFDGFLEGTDYTIASLQTEIDEGLYSIEGFEADFLADETEAGVPSESSIADLLTQYGYTVEEFDGFLEGTDYTIASLQTEIDEGLYSIEEFEADFLAED
jgi:hypothetical protein